MNYSCSIEKISNKNIYINIFNNFKYLDTYIVNGIKNPINLQRLNWGFPFSETEILNKKLEENYGKFINQEFLRNLEEYTFVINFYKRLQKQNLIIFY